VLLTLPPTVKDYSNARMHFFELQKERRFKCGELYGAWDAFYDS
jgi:hypothetical protein